MIPRDGVGGLELKVFRETDELREALGLAAKGKNRVARDGFAMVLIENTTGMPVTRHNGVWLIEGNFADHERNWVEPAH